ncbi:hypothetical protein AUF78_00860 [archaeon 13_1_20CM_2_51_12]|nr:MAG: hypothetical protein AUF78_00860 [archaeon 13_1_20CM_2_51_12]
MVDVLFIVLLVLHVGSIVAWMGGGALFLSVISPSLSKMSPSSRSEFVKLTLPRYFRFITGSSIIAIVVGLILYGYVTQVESSLAPSSSGLVSLQIGSVLGVIALIFVLGVAMPAGRKLVVLTSQVTSPNENMVKQIESLQRRLTMGARLGIALLGLTLILMILGAEI